MSINIKQNNSWKEAADVQIKVNGVWTSISDAYVKVNGEWVNTTGSVEIVSWGSGTAEQLKAMIDAHYSGDINLSDYWSLGDTRTITLPAMSATGVGESHAQQNVQLVLMDSTCTGFTLTGTSKKPKFIVGMKQCLNEVGYMNSSDINTNGWSGSARRTWCNTTYKTAVESVMPNIFKQFTWKTGQGGGSSSGLLTTNDYFALAPSKAVFGTGSSTNSTSPNAFSDESALYSQWNWYQNSSNIIKQTNGSNGYWWLASPYPGVTTRFCRVSNRGKAAAASAFGATNGISPFGCI